MKDGDVRFSEIEGEAVHEAFNVGRSGRGEAEYHRRIEGLKPTNPRREYESKKIVVRPGPLGRRWLFTRATAIEGVRRRHDVARPRLGEID